MGQQFKRQYRLLLGESAQKGLLLTSEDVSTDTGITGLHMTFEINKDTTKETNKSTIKIWNLSDESLDLIQKEDLMIELSVGYANDIGLVRIFIGTLITCTTKDENNGLDTVTTIKCSDGQIAVRDSIISQSFPPNTSSMVVLKGTAQAMGLALDCAKDVQAIQYANGYSFVGYAKDSLDAICKAMGACWSIQNGMLQVILNNGITRKQGLVFSPTSGLIGRPERIIRSSRKSNNVAEGERQEEKIVNVTGQLDITSALKQRKKQRAKKRRKTSQAGWKITTLLAPTVNPGDAIRIESGAVSGWFKVESVKHSGGIYKNDWTSEIHCIEVMLDE